MLPCLLAHRRSDQPELSVPVRVLQPARAIKNELKSDATSLIAGGVYAFQNTRGSLVKISTPWNTAGVTQQHRPALRGRFAVLLNFLDTPSTSSIIKS